MNGKEKIDILYEGIIKEIKRYQKDYSDILKVLYSKGLKEKILESYAVAKKLPHVQIMGKDVFINPFEDDLFADISLDMDMRIRGCSDISKKNNRCYDIKFVEDDLEQKIRDIAFVKILLKDVIANNISEIRNGLIEDADRLIKEATCDIDKMIGNLEKLREHDLDMSKYNDI